MVWNRVPFSQHKKRALARSLHTAAEMAVADRCPNSIALWPILFLLARGPDNGLSGGNQLFNFWERERATAVVACTERGQDRLSPGRTKNGFTLRPWRARFSFRKQQLFRGRAHNACGH